jgi:hypothetical protein
VRASAISLGAVILAWGVRSFYVRGCFEPGDVLACVLLLVPAALLLLLTGYVFQHARFAVVMPALIGVALSRAYPSFAVALGVALAGTAVVSSLRE